MTGLIIRRATRADQARLGALGALLVQQHHDFDQKRFLAGSPETAYHYGAFLASRLEDDDAVIFVADVEGTVIGYAFAALEGIDYLTLRGPAGLLHDLIVDPDYRGHGVGQRLLEATLAHLASRGAPRVVLSTAARNEAAQRLFTRMGFRQTMVEMTRESGEA